MAGKYFTSFEPLLKPDPIYGDLNVAKFISCLMRDGKRSTAEKVFYDALEVVGQRVRDRDSIARPESARRPSARRPA